MLRDKDVKLYHQKAIQNDMLPNELGLLRTNNIKIHPDYLSHSSLKPTGNISREQESLYILSNPTHSYYSIPKKSKTLSPNQKYQFKFNNTIRIEKNQIMTLFLCKSYEKLFSLFELYIKNLFSCNNKEEIYDLYQRELIPDSIYINVMKCLELIKDNKQLYRHVNLRNINNQLATTEIFLKIEQVENPHIKNDALLLIQKFIDLLQSIDEKLFFDEIDKLYQILENNNI